MASLRHLAGYSYSRSPRTGELNEGLLEELRAEIEAQYEEALHAIDVLEKYLQQSEPNALGQVDGRSRSRALGRQIPRSQRDLVLEVLRNNPGAGIEELARETGLGKQQVRGVLYAPKISKFIKRELTSDGLARYTVVEAKESA